MLSRRSDGRPSKRKSGAGSRPKPNRDPRSRADAAFREFYGELRRLRIPKVSREDVVPWLPVMQSPPPRLNFAAPPQQLADTLNEYVEPMVLDLVEFTEDLASDFCQALKSALNNLKPGTSETIGIWGISVDPARLLFLQVAVVLIDLLAAKAPYRGFVESAYGVLARDAIEHHKTRKGSGRPRGASEEGIRGWPLRHKKGLSWTVVAAEILGHAPNQAEEDRIRHAVREQDKRRRKIQEAWRKLTAEPNEG